jgi:hypothetical protein
MDPFIADMEAIGVTPILCLGYVTASGFSGLPSGMTVLASGLPDATDYGMYCKAWMDHYSSYPGILWEVFDQPGLRIPQGRLGREIFCSYIMFLVYIRRVHSQGRIYGSHWRAHAVDGRVR